MTLSPLVTIKGTTTIPKNVRDHLGIKPGDRVRFRLNKAGEYVVTRDLTLEEVRKMNSKYTKNAPHYTNDELKKLTQAGMAKQAVERYKRSLS